MNFKEYIKNLDEQNTIGYHNDGPGGPFGSSNGAILTSDQTGSEAIPKFMGNPNFLPSIDIVKIPNEIPTIKKESKILSVQKNQNPILVQLQDGTRLFFTLDEYRRISGGVPEPGKTMVVVMQRNPKDNSPHPSKIIKCEVKLF